MMHIYIFEKSKGGVNVEKKWKTIRVMQELAEEIEKKVEKNQYASLSEFVSDAIRLRLQAMTKERVAEYLERDSKSRVPHFQEQVFYTSNHVCCQETLQKTVKIGVTDYFLKELKGITGIDTLELGENVTKGDSFGIVETPAWWFLHDLISPVDGKIVKINEEVIANPFILNEDSNAWIIEVQPEDNRWADGLLTSPPLNLENV